MAIQQVMVLQWEKEGVTLHCRKEEKTKSQPAAQAPFDLVLQLRGAWPRGGTISISPSLFSHQLCPSGQRERDEVIVLGPKPLLSIPWNKELPDNQRGRVGHTVICDTQHVTLTDMTDTVMQLSVWYINCSICGVVL